MKRPSSPPITSPSRPDPTKKPKFQPDTTTPKPDHNPTDFPSNFSKLDENLLYEVFKHADPKTLASASCVNKLWYRTALDERLWELICTRHWSSDSTNYGSKQRRAVVLALGGFRLFYAKILYKTKAAAPSLAPPLISSGSASSSAGAAQPRVVVRGGSKKDEINLTLSLLSIRYYYDKMNLSTNKKL